MIYWIQQGKIYALERIPRFGPCSLSLSHTFTNVYQTRVFACLSDFIIFSLTRTRTMKAFDELFMLHPPGFFLDYFCLI